MCPLTIAPNKPIKKGVKLDKLGVEKSAKESSRLTREDWLNAAFQAVVKGGFAEARVLTLAEHLGVTRGSFYWHFADHAAMLDALVERWFDHQMLRVRQMAAQHTANPMADLDELVDLQLTRMGSDLKATRFELALRGLARRNPAVDGLVHQVDEARMAMFAQKFERVTGNGPLSNEVALLFYLTIVGCHQALGRPTNPPNFNQTLKRIIVSHLVERPWGAVQPAPFPIL